MTRIGLLITVLFFPLVSIATDLTDYRIFYINGMFTSAADYDTNKDKLGTVTGAPIEDRFHNRYLWLLDVVDVYVEKTGEAGNLLYSTTDLWLMMIAGKVPNSFFLEALVEVSVSNSDVGPFSAPDLAYMVGKVKNSLQTDKKTIIVSHSQGNFFYRNLWQEIKAWDSEKADQCLAGIGFASFLSSPLIGNYEWINSDNDRLLNWARTAVPSLLAPNITVPEGYGGDFWGHGFLDVYMSHPNSKGNYLAKLDDTVQLLDSSCDDPDNCLEPLGKKGGQGEWTYTYPLNNTTPHAVEISFEAFAIPDKITIKANGNTIATTNTEVSGFHTWTVDYDPAIHGTAFTAEVDAPDQNTEWQLCIDCAGAACEASSVPLERQSVFYNFSVDTSIWNCPATFTVDNEASPSSGTRKLTEGSHTFGFNVSGFCYCDSINSLACEQKKPKLTVRGTTYSLVPPSTEIKVNIGNSSTPGE